MFSKLRQLFGPPPVIRPPAIPFGERVYAVGDIHGRLDLFENLIDAIEADDSDRSPARTTIVLLGDLIDRGPDSAGVVARAREWAEQRPVDIIQGNHEEMLLAAREHVDTMRSFLKFGGRETIQSYGVDPDLSDDMAELQIRMNAAIPQADVDFLTGFQKMVRIGDYVFVHAGVRPNTPLDHQMGSDCRWIREPFLSYRGDFGGFVVHGHTITEEPDVCTNRIGIDTGAVRHGTLTAIGLQGTQRWFIQARETTTEPITFATA
ncbi:metallophosphoesterase [Novosphingobium sp. Rr 2-17]|uniref:metallophosphoesterase n=1 Tax=Novosphingobium sp. Rr 2-17 TaxID=555793 RepID=UPI0005B830FF|nr:metallophosphoesterase [Novosphingobium sp. Rr 2-17]